MALYREFDVKRVVAFVPSGERITSHILGANKELCDVLGGVLKDVAIGGVAPNIKVFHTFFDGVEFVIFKIFDEIRDRSFSRDRTTNTSVACDGRRRAFGKYRISKVNHNSRRHISGWSIPGILPTNTDSPENFPGSVVNVRVPREAIICNVGPLRCCHRGSAKSNLIGRRVSGSSSVNDGEEKRCEPEQSYPNLMPVYATCFVGSFCHAPLLALIIFFVGLGAFAVRLDVEVFVIDGISVLVVAFSAAQYVSTCQP